MLKVTLLFLGFIVFFVLTLRLAVILMGRFAGVYVDKKHKAAETIVNTGRAPKDWTSKFERKIKLTKEAGGSPSRIMAIKEKARGTLLKKIDQLTEYFKASTLVQDEETRQILLNELRKARRRWEEEDWEEIITS